MIHFSLKCAASHEFEGWFRDGDAFESQAAAGEIACPHCGGTGVEKAIMAPRVARSSKAEPKPEPADPAKLKQALRELRKQIEAKFDYVGERFADEARKIHKGEVDPRAIYGEASQDEARALADDGIEFGRIPWIPPNDA
jgi:hypothetical protein